MPGKTIAEKILAKASGNFDAKAGDVVEAMPDVVMSHENTYLVDRSFRELGLPRPINPERIVVVLDHRSPANTAQTASVHAAVRRLVKNYGIRNFFDVGEGICHQILVEERLVKPWQLVLGADSHTTTAGAIGAFGTGVGATEIAGVWATSSLWLKVPETKLIHLSGHLSKGTCPKDVALELARRMGASGADYRCMEFVGELIPDLPVAGRMVLCNMAMELGAKAAIVPPDAVTREWFRGYDLCEGGDFWSDNDCMFEETVQVDTSKIPPMVSGPHKVEAADSIAKLEGLPVNQAFIGTCTNGRLEDLIAASKILKGRKVSRGCRLIVAAASRKVLEEAVELGVAGIIVSAGGTLIPPGCGPCLGSHEGVLGPGEVCISTSNRNFRGRMGSDEAEIYLASPSTVAASAVEGRIADPRRYLE